MFALVGLAALRTPAPSQPDPGSATTFQTILAPTPTPPVASSLAPAVSSSAPPEPPKATASAPTAARANVTLLGEPGTRVSVDGAARGACPAKLALDPGQHEVRFTFDPTGETLGEHVTVKSGERVTVRATFTGATPTVKIIR